MDGKPHDIACDPQLLAAMFGSLLDALQRRTGVASSARGIGGVSITDLKVLRAIIGDGATNPGGEVMVHHKNLAESLGIPHPNVTRSITRLRKAGLLRRLFRGKNGVHYVVEQMRR